MNLRMILSASRRTDIPAFYARWFIQRIRAGYCLVPNPFNQQQVARVDLTPPAVEAIVFWTRNPRPLFPFLHELDQAGYRYYFQYTLLDYPRAIDPHVPAAERALSTLQELAQRVGPQRVIWRYDPLLLSHSTDVEFHRRTYERLARSLRGACDQVVISLLDHYTRADQRLRRLTGSDLTPYTDEQVQTVIPELATALAQISQAQGLRLVSCAEIYDLRPYGIQPGPCVDDGYLQRVFGLNLTAGKDPTQRAACRCVVSKDIGAYDTCLFGCRYCYATQSFERARQRYAAHDPQSPALS